MIYLLLMTYDHRYIITLVEAYDEMQSGSMHQQNSPAAGLGGNVHYFPQRRRSHLCLAALIVGYCQSASEPWNIGGHAPEKCELFFATILSILTYATASRDGDEGAPDTKTRKKVYFIQQIIVHITN